MAEETTDLGQVIQDSAGSPRSVTTEQGSATAHSLPDQIAADRYMRSRAASRSPFSRLARARVSFGRADGNPTRGSAPLAPYPTDEIPR